jgi:RNA polymerase sigma factor (TIGR02999 family)
MAQGPVQDPNVSDLLLRWRAGDSAALDRLMPLIYDELHALARRQLHGERSNHTLQTTALVHEAYLRLVGSDVRWEGRVHFLAVAAQTMRHILVDHARSRARQRRGGGITMIPIEDSNAVAPAPAIDLVVLDEALDRLAALDGRKARAAELHYFGGMSYVETAQVLGISAATVHRELRVAKAWLCRELGQEHAYPASAT